MDNSNFDEWYPLKARAEDAPLPEGAIPEKRLLIAFLQQVADDLGSRRMLRAWNGAKKGQAREAFRTALEWIDREDGVFSLPRVAEWLGIDPEALKQHLKEIAYGAKDDSSSNPSKGGENPPRR